MADQEGLREAMRMSGWGDKDLVHMLAQRFTEQTVIAQLSTVSVEEGTAFGIELLLQPETEYQLPDGISRDKVLDAMTEEVRQRIAHRIEHGAYQLNG